MNPFEVLRMRNPAPAAPAIATVADAQATFTTTAGNKSVTMTCAVGDYLVAFLIGTGGDGTTQFITDSDSGGWTNRFRVANGGTARYISCYYRANVATAGSKTFTLTSSGDTGGGLVVIRITGIQAGGGVRAYGTEGAGGAGATPSIALTQASQGGAAILGVCVDTGTGTTPADPAGFTAGPFGNYTNPGSGFRAPYKSNSAAIASLTWGGAATSAWVGGVVEVNPTTTV